MHWYDISIFPPPNNACVMTKIDDRHGVRNVQKLKLNRGLWWLVDESMYVYYRPTHWAFAT